MELRFDLNAEIERIHDVNNLQDLCLEMADFQDAEALRARLTEMIKSQGTESPSP